MGKQKRGQAFSVVERMTGGKIKALLGQVILGWIQSVGEDRRVAEIEAQLKQEQMQEISALQEKLKSLQAQVEEKKEDALDAQEELAETKSHSGQLVQAVKKLQELHGVL